MQFIWLKNQFSFVQIQNEVDEINKRSPLTERQYDMWWVFSQRLFM